jgi:putative ABC transport system permease protein
MFKNAGIRHLAAMIFRDQTVRNIMVALSSCAVTVMAATAMNFAQSVGAGVDTHISADVGVELAYYIVILVPIVICSFLTTYDCFYMSIIKDIRLYGMLTAVGAAKNQLRGFACFQAVCLAAIGAATGALLCFPVTHLLLPMISGDIFGKTASSMFNVYGSSLMIAGGMSFFTVICGAYAALVRSESFTCIEKLYFDGADTPENFHTALSNKFSLGRGMPNPRKRLLIPRMAFKNSLRYAGRNVFALLSVVLALTSLLMTNVIVNGVNPAGFAAAYVGDNDFKLYNLTFAPNYVEPGSFEELQRQGGINVKSEEKEVFDDGLLSAIAGDEAIDSMHVIKYLPAQVKRGNGNGLDFGYESCTILIVDADYVSHRFSQKNVSLPEESLAGFEKGELAFMERYDYTGSAVGTDAESPGGVKGNFTKGTDSISLGIFDINAFSFELAWMPADGSEGNPFIDNSFAYYIHSSAVNSGTKPIVAAVQIRATEENRPALQERLDILVDARPLVEMESRDRYMEFMRIKKVMTYALGNMFALMLLIIAMLDFANMSIVGMHIRRGEYMLLRSIGMTRRQWRISVGIENAAYAATVFVVMLLITNPIAFGMYNVFKDYYSVFIYPWKQIFWLFFAAAILLVGIPQLIAGIKNRS